MSRRWAINGNNENARRALNFFIENGIDSDGFSLDKSGRKFFFVNNMRFGDLGDFIDDLEKSLGGGPTGGTEGGLTFVASINRSLEKLKKFFTTEQFLIFRQRIDLADTHFTSYSYLSAVLMLGSLLEGVLTFLLKKNREKVALPRQTPRTFC